MLPRSQAFTLALPAFALIAFALKALALPSLEVPQPKLSLQRLANATDEPADTRIHWVSDLWRVEFSVNDIITLASTGFRHETRFEDIKYSVGPFPDMLVSPTSLAGSFWSKLFEPSGTLLQLWESAGPPHLPPLPQDPTKREILVGRHAAFRCNDSIRAQTAGSRKTASAPNTFMISSRLIWPVKWTQGPISMDLGEGSSIYALTEQEVPYEYQLLVNKGTVDLPGYAAVTGMRKITRNITYTITRKRMDLELLPQCSGAQTSDCVKDLVGTLTFCLGCRRLTDNLALDTATGDYHIHPNIEIRLEIDGEDATHYMMTAPGGNPKYFDIARRRRTWDAPLLADNQSVGSYQPVPGHGNVVNGWYDDYTGLIGGLPNWRDMPSVKDPVPDKWLKLRLVEEFLVGVKRFPEFGFIYFATMVDTRPGGWYRVRQTRARPITEDEWCTIERSSTGPQVHTAPIRDDSGWCNLNPSVSAPGCVR